MGKRSREKQTRKTRIVHLDPETASELQRLKHEFKRKFGRDPGPDDPLFFDPDSDEPKPISADVMTREIAAAMIRANIEPAKIYAFQKTGRLSFSSPEDEAEWNAAVEEYEKGQTLQ
jgi:integrase